MPIYDKTVCVDAGHGGSDVGAVGQKGTHEAERALDVCLRLEKLLLPYVNVVMTRRTDVYIPRARRAEISNDADADVFLSYHFNSAESPNVPLSWEVYSTRGQNNSDKLATKLGISQESLFPNQEARIDMSDGDLDKEANFTVIRKANCPACLFEGEFIHTAHGEKAILNERLQQLRAQAMFEGIMAFLEIEIDGEVTPPTEPDLLPQSNRARIETLESKVEALLKIHLIT